MNPLVIIGLGIAAVGFLAQKLPVAKSVPALQNRAVGGSNDGGDDDGKAVSDSGGSVPGGDNPGEGSPVGAGTARPGFDLTEVDDS